MAMMVLQWRYWSLIKAIVLPSFMSAATPCSPSASTSASNKKPGSFSIDASAVMATPSLVSMLPIRGATSRGTAPRSSSAACTDITAAPPDPLAINIAIFRAVMVPSPGRASNDSAGERVTSGASGLARALGSGSGRFLMPRPSATCRANGSDTLRSNATTRSLMAGTVSLLNSNLKPAAICACSTGVWLSKNSVAWV